MSAGPDWTWAETTLRRFGPQPNRVARTRILEGRITYEHPTQLVTYAAAENLAHFGLAKTTTHGLEAFACTLTAKGDEELDRLLGAEARAS
jgi:hypothetical protein